MKRAAASLAVLLLLAAGAARAEKIDPAFRFRTIETEHFSIHYHEGLEEAAAKVAGFAEEVDRKLTNAFHWSPADKTQVVLLDSRDFANGFSITLPYNAVYIYPVPPSIDQTIGEYDDWLRTVFLHEYAHVVTGDAVRGYSAVMRRIFGRPIPAEDLFSLLVWLFAAPPNTFLPAWWHEGMATWAESEFSAAGRGRSAYYDMVFRMAVADNSLPSVDQVNESLPYWPDGHFRYLYGLRLQKFIADRYGKEALAGLNTAHSGRAPYFIGAPPEEISNGKSYKALYAEMIGELLAEQQSRIDALKASPLSASAALPLDGEILSNPRYSPDGRLLAVNRQDPHGHETIVVANADGTSAREAARRLLSDRAIAWSPDGSAIYFCQAEYTRGYSVYQDLYRLDLQSGRTRRLTTGMRLREPDLSQDGKTFAVVEGSRGSQNLAILSRRDDGTGGRDEFLLETVTKLSLARVSGPRFSPDGGRIAYAATGNDGRSGLYVYDVRESKGRLLFEQESAIGSPAWSKDGRYIVYSSDETGVYNLFAYDMSDGSRRQVTHLLGGAFQPDLSGGKIAYSGYHARGFRIETVDLDPATWRAASGPAIRSYWDNAARTGTDNAGGRAGAAGNAAAATPERASAPESKPYSAFPTLLPRFWLPTIIGDKDGDVAPGAFTAGADVLGYHAWLAESWFGADSHRLFFNAAYRYDRLLPTFRLQGYSLPVVYSDLMQSGEDYYEADTSAIAEMAIPVPYLESRYRFAFGYRFLRQRALSDLVDDRFHGLAVFQGRRDSLYASILYSDALKYPYSVSREEGRDFSLTYRFFSSRLGSELDSREYVASYGQYFRVPAESLRHHVVFGSVKAGASSGDRPVQQSFQIGGVPSTLAEFPLRGYPSRFETGKYAATGTLEYRFPIWYVFRGPGTAPIFLDRLHGSVFFDAGEVWGSPDSFSGSRLRTGAGVELRSDIDLGYYIGITPALGFARGFNEHGRTEVYFTIYADL